MQSRELLRLDGAPSPALRGIPSGWLLAFGTCKGTTFRRATPLAMHGWQGCNMSGPGYLAQCYPKHLGFI